MLKRFASDRKGIAAIEFAMLLPIMASVIVLTLDVSLHVVNRMRMESAIRSGIQYLMYNGRDLDQLQSVVETSWSPAPANAVVTTERYCLCFEARHTCTVLCSDDSAPESYFGVSTSGTLDGFVVNTTLQGSEEIRVR